MRRKWGQYPEYLAIRLPQGTHGALDATARKLGWNKSQVGREAIKRFVKSHLEDGRSFEWRPEE